MDMHVGSECGGVEVLVAGSGNEQGFILQS